MRELLRFHTLAHRRNTSTNIGSAGRLLVDFFDENSEWEMRPLTGKISANVLAVPGFAIGLLVCSETLSVRLQKAIDAGTNVMLWFSLSYMFAAASTGQHYFDAFNTDILDPATCSQIFITLLVFLACWDSIISFTTEPSLGPILRGIIQARALTGILQ
jgi:hypothetical protein